MNIIIDHFILSYVLYFSIEIICCLNYYIFSLEDFFWGILYFFFRRLTLKYKTSKVSYTMYNSICYIIVKSLNWDLTLNIYLFLNIIILTKFFHVIIIIFLFWLKVPFFLTKLKVPFFNFHHFLFYWSINIVTKI